MKMLRIRQIGNLVRCLGTFIRAWVLSLGPGYFHFGLGIFLKENAQAMSKLPRPCQMVFYDIR